MVRVDENATGGKQKGLGNKPSPNYYQSIVERIVPQTDVTQSNNYEEESPYKPETTLLCVRLRLKNVNALIIAPK
jgi:hypothetical protein